jgi:hypothetical protein
MSSIILFPKDAVSRRPAVDAREKTGSVIILPVVRIERYIDAVPESIEPGTQPPAGNGRRRRAKRR